VFEPVRGPIEQAPDLLIAEIVDRQQVHECVA
jgi:hypothetical protein